MNVQRELVTSGTSRRSRRSRRPALRQDTWIPALILVAAVLAGCSGGGSVNIANSQTADPGTVDFPIFYVKRTVLTGQAMTQADDVRMMRDAFPQADLYMRASASPSATETNITQRITKGQMWDVKDVDVAADGTKVAFAMRGPLTLNMMQEDPPSWRIYEYTIKTDTLTPMIDPALDTAPATVNDVSPHYLPPQDGRIVFSSTRQRQSQAVLLDESKPQFVARDEAATEPTFNLHLMPADRNPAGITQISFNQSHDRDTTVLKSGRILWTRWDAAPGHDGMHLYSANPDGTDLQLFYGANSHMTGTNNTVIEFMHPREMQSGKMMVIARQYSGVDFGGNIIVIDAQNYVENTQPFPAGATGTGPAQIAPLQNSVYTMPGPSPGGRFNSAFPLWDGTNRIIVSWTQCRLLASPTSTTIVPCTDAALAAPNATAAPPLYSVWMFNPGSNTFLPLMQPQEGVMVTDVVATQPRQPSDTPNVIPEKIPGVNLSQTLVDAGVGVIDIKSVYDFDGIDTASPSLQTLMDGKTPASQRPARFVRLEKPVSIPDDEKVLNLRQTAFGASPFMREIMGYAPIEPDGSLRLEVPANVAFTLSILDANGRQLGPSQGTWLQLRAGEVVTCNGCHTPAATQNVPACTTPTALCPTPHSHGRSGTFNAYYKGAPGGAPFPNSTATFTPNSGETMAETRARVTCVAGSVCSSVPAVDVIYTDVWTDTSTGATRNPSFGYLYEALKTAIPTSGACVSMWAANCRITINYPEHIQALWDYKRVVLDSTGTVVVADHTCSQAGCHNTKDAAGKTQVPAGQLDLTSTASNAVPDHPVSYEELLFQHPEQQVNMAGQLQNVPGPIVNGVATTIPVGPYLDVAGANGSNSAAFMARFAAGSPSNHAGWLTPAELRLISEWLDIGAQFFNNPFDPAAPHN